jgi:triacylglycerol lipase
MAQSNKSKSSSSAGSFSWLLFAAVPAFIAGVYYPGARNAFFGNGGDVHPAVTIRQGTVVGKFLDDGKFPEPIEGFLGIPYALPPVNDLRFREAVPVPDGNGTLEAYFLGPRCVRAWQ